MFGLCRWIRSWFDTDEEINLNLASHAKGTNLLSDYDIMVEYLGFSHKEAETAVARMRLQKLEDMKLQALFYNPGLGGLPLPSVEEAQEADED